MDDVKKLAALKAADDSLAFWHNDSPKCPHCGGLYDVADNDAWRVYEEGEHDLTCDKCGHDFIVSSHVAYTFSTDEQEDDEEDDTACTCSDIARVHGHHFGCPELHTKDDVTANEVADG